MADNEDTVLALVKRIVASELSTSATDVTPALGLYGHPRWDSLTHVNILVRLEAEGGLILADRITEELTTVQQLADRIRGKQ